MSDETTASGRPPVFLHASMRTSSTWLWSEFRRIPEAWAYCETFHFGLDSLTEANADTIGPRTWRSHHPDTAPYFLEFKPLLRPDGGVQGFEPYMTFGAFVPPGGLAGSLSAAEARYVASLVALAHAHHRVPVLSDTFSLGRMRGLARQFGGFHVFLHRNLYHQWLSYRSQARAGNATFIDATRKQVAASGHEAYFAWLARRYPAEPVDLPAQFYFHCGFHLYLYLNAHGAADLVIDVTRLSREPDLQREAERAIVAATGLDVHLGGAREHVEFLGEALPPVGEIRDELSALLEEALACLAPILAVAPARAFGEGLIEAVLEEVARFEALAEGPLRALREVNAALEGEVARLRREALEVAEAHEVLLRSTSWRLTAPLRWVGRLLSSRRDGAP